MTLLFDLDNTLINSEIAKPYRTARNWRGVYEQIPKFTLFDGLIESLHEISAEHPIYIVTSSPSSYAQKVCTAWNIPNLGITAYHDTSNHKPHPAPFTHTLQRFKLDSDKCLSFGDDQKDIISSKAAGIKAVACLWGSIDINGIVASNPDYTLHRTDELINFLIEL